MYSDSEPSDEVQAFVHDLFQAHYVELCRFAYRYVNSRAVAEELVQECFYRVWRQAGVAGPDDERITRAYLYRAVRNQALNHLKHRRVEEAWETADRQREPDVAPSPDQTLDTAELGRAIREAVEQLPERCRAVFVLRRDQGMSYDEIATTLGLSEKTVENHMGRALRSLRERLKPYLAVAALVTSVAEVVRVLR